MQRILAATLAAGLVLAAPSAFAGGETLSNGQAIHLPEGADALRSMRVEIEASGTLVIEPDGRVSEVNLKMKPALHEDYQRAIKAWTFEPVQIDGRIVRAEAHFELTGFGQLNDGSSEIQFGVENVTFIDPPQAHLADSVSASGKALPPPSYPALAAEAGLGASVMLLLQIAEDGSVADAGILSLSLEAWQVESRRQAENFARSFAERTLRAARNWSFAGHPAVTPGDCVMVPVNFVSPRRPSHGLQPQIPIAVTPLPWMHAAQQEAIAMTAFGTAHSTRFQLVNDVAGTTIN